MHQEIEEELRQLFLDGNHRFLEKHHLLLERKVNERTLCGALMLELSRSLENQWKFLDCFVDIEYNRIDGAKKALPRKLMDECDDGDDTVRIYPDIIIHRRGKRYPDNLLVLEMKKSTATSSAKLTDRKRLKVMTAQDGIFLYKLGIFYVIDFEKYQVCVEYYVNGKLYLKEELVSYREYIHN